MRKKVFFFILFIVIVVAVWKIGGRDGIKSIPVKEVKIENRVVTKTVSASGEIKSKKEANLAFKVAGRILSRNVSESEKVKTGQLLARLDSSSEYQDLQVARDARDITLRDKQVYIESQKDTWEKKSVNDRAEYYETLRRYDEYISEAEATFNAAWIDVKNTYIYSPFDGIVVDLPKQIGEVVATTTTVVKLADLNTLVFKITLDQEDYGLVRKGQDVEVKLDAYPDTPFKGKIVELPLFADGGDTASFEVEIVLDVPSDSTNKPLLGMTGDAEIAIASSDGEVSSLMYDQIHMDENDKPFVWVIDNGLISKQSVEIGLEGDIYTEIKSKIDKTIIVSVNNEVEIKEGYRAKIMKSK